MTTRPNLDNKKLPGPLFGEIVSYLGDKEVRALGCVNSRLNDRVYLRVNPLNRVPDVAFANILSYLGVREEGRLKQTNHALCARVQGWQVPVHNEKARRLGLARLREDN